MSTSNPNTYTARVACDIRDVATVAQFLYHNNALKPTRSSMVRWALEWCVTAIKSKHPEFAVESVANASHILTNLGIEVLGADNRNKRTLMKAISAEDMMAGGDAPTGAGGMGSGQADLAKAIATGMKSVESSSEAESRRKNELAEMKTLIKQGNGAPIAEE